MVILFWHVFEKECMQKGGFGYLFLLSKVKNYTHFYFSKVKKCIYFRFSKVKKYDKFVFLK